VFNTGVERALRVALAAHAGQLRKGEAEVPYITHPLHVALILAQWGLESEVVQAGVLHDVVEDCEGWSIERVDAEFGAGVAELVAALTEDKSKSWAERKQYAVDHVADMPLGAAMVKAADKLHNLCSLRADLEASADASEVWERFRGKREGTLRMAEALVTALEARLEARLTVDLRATLEALRAF
jgi:(p)ppGpp synthase/HD superfamily hydrolase